MTGPRECYGFSRVCFLKINYQGNLSDIFSHVIGFGKGWVIGD